MSFGADGPAAFRHGTRLIRKILEGRRPKDIPIEQPTKFELVINNKAAKAMGRRKAPNRDGASVCKASQWVVEERRPRWLSIL
jgi:ABC-type uncharacterized transport system substrate-binding protein